MAIKRYVFGMVVPVVLHMSACGNDGSQSEEVCPSGMTRCEGTCVDTGSDTNHCGSCLAECGASELCDQGVCVAACPSHQTLCDGSCVDVGTSASHCGNCGHACSSVEVCQSGVCSAACTPPLVFCEDECVNTRNDPNHCGGCESSCDPGLVCADGSCTQTCGELALCHERCVDVMSDPENCGACDMACDAGYACEQGNCVLGCTKVDCDGECVDTSIDPANCGACGSVCGLGEVCDQGVCAAFCGPGVEECFGSCTNTGSDPANCGACGNVCSVEEVCSEGACTVVCGPGVEQCGGSCTDTSTDPVNCGDCGVECDPGLVCSQGACVLACSGGSTQCGNFCVDTSNDPQNCGDCGTVCSHDEVCVGGICANCPAGMEQCDGACVDTSSSVQHCGGCGNACPHSGHGDAECAAGECEVECDPGWADCDGNGYCESRLTLDGNCGACGVTCPSGQTCESGTCTPCQQGTTYCSGACVDTTAHPDHCGGCGLSCPHLANTNIYCVAGVCSHSCFSGCVDCDEDMATGCEVRVTTDRKNCGTCGVQCGDDEICSSGTCQACAADQTRCGNNCKNTLSDKMNCGGCGVNCVTSAPNGVSVCQAGVCSIECKTSYLDCDGNPLTGCETKNGHDNCGACSVVCSSDSFCGKSDTCEPCVPTELPSTLPISVSGTTVGEPDTFSSSCGPGVAPDAYFTFTAPAAGTYTVDTVGSSFDSVLELRDGSCRGEKISCHNGPGNEASRTVSLDAGQTIIIIVDGRYSSQGQFVLNVHSP